jgi:Mg2+ and Co2+ transporter CorA
MSKLTTKNWRDFAIVDSGSVVLFQPLTPAATEWLKENCPSDAEHRYLGGNLAIEPRYLESILTAAYEDGLNGPHC